LGLKPTGGEDASIHNDFDTRIEASIANAEGVYISLINRNLAYQAHQGMEIYVANTHGVVLAAL
jgi:hypothetical protein